jgi:hypothetical protein
MVLDHRSTETNGVHLRCAAQSDGALVILLHGFPECGCSWRHQIAPLAPRFRVVTPDLRRYRLSLARRSPAGSCLAGPAHVSTWMNLNFRKFAWRLWWVALLGFAALVVFPVSNRPSRLVVLLLTLFMWFGLISLMWHRRKVRVSLSALTLLAGIFLLMPGRRQAGSRAPPARVRRPTGEIRGDPIHLGRRESRRHRLFWANAEGTNRRALLARSSNGRSRPVSCRTRSLVA